MLAQIATALLAFASHHKLEDAEDVPTRTVYATAGTSGWKAVSYTHLTLPTKA